MTNVLKENRLSVSEATSTLIKAVLKMSGDEIISLLNELEKDLPDNKMEPRLNYSADVAFSVEEKFYTGYISNINANGVFIETKNSFQSGQKMTLSFQLPNHPEYIKLNGKIILVSKEGVDVLFDVSIENSLEPESEDLNTPLLGEDSLRHTDSVHGA